LEARPWKRLHNEFQDCLNGVQRLAALVSPDEGEEKIIGKIRSLYAGSVRAIYRALFADFLPSLVERCATVATRCEHLLTLPVAFVAAIGDPDRYRASGLPLDLHPRTPESTTARLVALDGDWPAPRADEVRILIADDLGYEALLTPTSPTGERSEGEKLNALWIMAIATARNRGAVVQSLHVDSFLDAIEGDLGPFVQIVSHTGGTQDEPVLPCRDGSIDLRKLVVELKLARASGVRSKVLAADVTSCRSSGALSEAFHALGVELVASSPVFLHPREIAIAMHRIYDQGLLDGHTQFQHAWLWSMLPSAEPAAG
jgi:hypothetical protein